MPSSDQRALTAPNAPFFASLPPVYAGFFRGFALALALGALEAAIHYLQIGPHVPPAWAVFVPVILVALRTAEGLIDHQSTDGGNAPLAATLETAVADAVAAALAMQAAAPAVVVAPVSLPDPLPLPTPVVVAAPETAPVPPPAPLIVTATATAPAPAPVIVAAPETAQG